MALRGGKLVGKAQRQRPHPGNGTRPFKKSAYPLLGNPGGSGRGPGNSADNGCRRVSIPAQVDHFFHGSTKVAGVPQLAIDGQRDRVVNVPCHAALQSKGVGKLRSGRVPLEVVFHLAEQIEQFGIKVDCAGPCLVKECFATNAIRSMQRPVVSGQTRLINSTASIRQPLSRPAAFPSSHRSTPRGTDRPHLPPSQPNPSLQ